MLAFVYQIKVNPDMYTLSWLTYIQLVRRRSFPVQSPNQLAGRPVLVLSRQECDEVANLAPRGVTDRD